VRWAWILVVVACAPGRPEKLRNPPRHRPPPTLDDAAAVDEKRPPPQLVPLPYIPGMTLPDLDFHDELRWPLTPMNHPAMEPKFPIAERLAQPGIGWLQLCDRGITNRHGVDEQLVTYLRGWCKAVAGDVDAACGHLAPLMKAGSGRLATAVRNDIANILAQGNADDAAHFIRVHSMRDVGMLDFLAANYAEVGTSGDALAINWAAIDSDDFAPAATTCIRLTKHIVLSDDRKSPHMQRMQALAGGKFPDPTCERKFHKLMCWADGKCELFYRDEGVAPTGGSLLYAYSHWTLAEGSNSSSTWWLVADGAMSASMEAGFADLAIAAMENAVRVDLWSTDACSENTSKWLAKHAPTLLGQQNAALTKRVEALKAACSTKP
jgi:hypothetical protein